MEVKERSKQLAKPNCFVCRGSGMLTKDESCKCTITTFPDWKGCMVTKKPSDPFFEHDFNRRPG